MGQNYTKAEVKQLVAEIDEDGNGEVDIDEFVVLMAPILIAHEEEAAANTFESRSPGPDSQGFWGDGHG
eukprot:8514_5